MSSLTNRRQAMVTGVSLCLSPLARAANKMAAAPILIGRSLPLTGIAKVYAEQRQEGHDLYFDLVNASGGIAGQKLQIITLDDNYTPEGLGRNIRAFDEEHKAVALFGFLGPSLPPNFSLIEERQIPLIAGTAPTSLRKPSQKYIFPMRVGFAEEAEAIAKHLGTVNVRRVAVVEQDVPLGELGAKSFLAALTSVGIKPTVIKVSSKDDGLVALAARQLKETESSAVLFAAVAQVAAAVVREYRKIGRLPAMFSFASINASALIAELGELAEGFVISQVVPVPTSKAQPVAREYQVAVAAASKRGKLIARTYYGLEAYLEARLLVEGLRRVSRGNPITRETVFRTFDRLGEVNLGGYMVRYENGERQGSSFVELTYITLKGTIRR